MFLYNNKYMRYIRSQGYLVTYNYLVLIFNRRWIDELQEHLNKTENSSLITDGIFGISTMLILGQAIDKNKNYLSEFVSTMMEDKTDTPTDRIELLRQPLMNFLAEVEGTTIHINGKTESQFTTPYGVYSLYFPKSKPVIYVNSLFKKYSLNKKNKSDIRRINDFLTNDEKMKIQDLCWEFYKENFMSKGIITLLNDMTSISYLSISINGGKGRGIKAIQSAIGATVDGKVGKQTLTLLSKNIESNGYKQLNFNMLEYMILFYANLIKKKRKFFVYRNGWYNRLYKTACELFKKKYKRIPL